MANQLKMAKVHSIKVLHEQGWSFRRIGQTLGIHRTTDSDGEVLLRLPEGEYEFRADFQGSQYWSDTTWAAADQPPDQETQHGAGEKEEGPLAGRK